MKHSLPYLIFFLIFPWQIFGQDMLVKGTITDSKTGEALAFVNIVSNDGRGAVSDIDGKFVLKPGHNTRTLSFSYVGYQPKTVDIDFESSRLRPKHSTFRRSIFSPAKTLPTASSTM